jgi:tetratricopeptide (TPR) repeat protein
MPSASKPDGYIRPVAVTLLLNLEAADGDSPAGLASPALALASMLDPAGHPAELWATDAVTGYLTQWRAPGADAPVSADEADTALRVLHRYALITHARTDAARAVRVHAVTARAMRETLADIAPGAVTAANALLTLWPANDSVTTELTMSLQANVSTLQTVAGDHLWNPEAHPLLNRAGFGLLNAQLFTAAIPYWSAMADQTQRLLGPEHPQALAARGNLAMTYGQAGRPLEGIILLEKVLADQERLFGPAHPGTLAARASLAVLYRKAGRTGEAIAVSEQLLSEQQHHLHTGNNLASTMRDNLASAYGEAGRSDEAIALHEQQLAEQERLNGPKHSSIIAARGNLATSYGQAGRFDDAITVLERILDGQDELFGKQHPMALGNRNNLAYFYAQVGRLDDAVALGEQILADSELRLGSDHPGSSTARTNLAFFYARAGRTRDAIALFEQLVASYERIHGPRQPVPLAFRINIAYLSGDKQRAEAVRLLRLVLAECERVAGPQHPIIMAIRSNIAFIEELTDPAGDVPPSASAPDTGVLSIRRNAGDPRGRSSMKGLESYRPIDLEWG